MNLTQQIKFTPSNVERKCPDSIGKGLLKPSIVIKQNNSRSYTVKTSVGGEYCRNRRHLVNCKQLLSAGKVKYSSKSDLTPKIPW